MEDVINASEFKAKCLALLDEVARTGKSLTILKHGRVVAQLVPPRETQAQYPQESLLGTVRIEGDVVSPCLEATEWEVESGSL